MSSYINNFDYLFNGLSASLDEFHPGDRLMGYTANAPSQFDTDQNNSYLTVPDFDSPLSSLPSNLSSFSPSRVNTPTYYHVEGSAPSDDDNRSDSDSDVEPLSLYEDNPSTATENIAYPIPNAYVSSSAKKYQSHQISRLTRYDDDILWVPPPSPPQSQRPTRNLRQRTELQGVTALTFDPDKEACIESDSGDATDDEYIPTPPLNPLKRQRSPEPTTSSFPSVSSVATSRASSPVAARPTKRQRTSQNGRSSKASTSQRRSDWTAEDNTTWKCPQCDHIQWNKRGPDFRRHQRTHTRADNPTPFVCWGVLVEHASTSKRPIPADKRGIAVEYEGVWRVGGCFTSFSRLDAFKRHLHETKRGKQCATDFDSFHRVRDY